MNLFPRPPLARAGSVCLKTLLKHLPVPIRNRNLLGLSGNAVPQRLNVVKLLVHRKLVEAGGWERESSGHNRRSIPLPNGHREGASMIDLICTGT
jgi:hypothetical protein